MTERKGDHWSIGEVLSLIQEEFPDVTISKIRFLESRGLVSPERTPSGYRRFYRDDFERLQWILRQQRDHYLPLKVIRARLESGDLDGNDEVDDAPVLPFDGAGQGSSRSKPRTGKPMRKTGDGDAHDENSAAEDDDASDVNSVPDASDDNLAEVVSIDRSSPKSASERLDSTFAEVAKSLEQTRSYDASSSRPDTKPASDLVRKTMTSTASDDNSASADHTKDVAPLDAVSATAHEVVRDTTTSVPNNSGQATAPVQSSDGIPRERRTERRGRSTPELGSNSALTKDELAEASGCTLETLLALERFGLLSGRTIGPTVLYDGEALRVAQLAARFVSYGLEPRHLRSFKIGAEREVSLLTQVVEPMLYRRDEQAREQSMAALDDMVELSASLHAILVQQMVREQLPSQRG